MTEPERNRERGAMEEMGKGIGEAAGRMAGRAADMAADMAAPLFRSAANVLGGWWSQDSARDAARFSERDDKHWREHYEGHGAASGSGTTGASTGAGGTRGYEDIRPYYQLGHTAAHNPEYASRNFEEVEPDLQRVWNEGEEAADAWPEARGFVEFGFDAGAAGGSAGGGLRARSEDEEERSR